MRRQEQIVLLERIGPEQAELYCGQHSSDETAVLSSPLHLPPLAVCVDSNNLSSKSMQKETNTAANDLLKGNLSFTSLVLTRSAMKTS